MWFDNQRVGMDNSDSNYTLTRNHEANITMICWFLHIEKIYLLSSSGSWSQVGDVSSLHDQTQNLRKGSSRNFLQVTIYFLGFFYLVEHDPHSQGWREEG